MVADTMIDQNWLPSNLSPGFMMMTVIKLSCVYFVKAESERAIATIVKRYFHQRKAFWSFDCGRVDFNLGVVVKLKLDSISSP
jgi:hypothetical protein